MKRNQKTWAFFGKSAGGGEARLTWAKSSLELLILHVGYGDDGDDDEHNVYDDDDDDDDVDEIISMMTMMMMMMMMK